MAQTARTAATTSFTLDAQARRYRDLYARLIAREPEVRIPVTLFAETNVDSFDWALNVLEQQKSVLEQEKAVLEQEKAALTQEKAALTQKRAALAHEKIALMEENCMLARQTSDPQIRTIASEKMESLS
jgi:hypothetical protein